jgi:hypothetical protein
VTLPLLSSTVTITGTNFTGATNVELATTNFTSGQFTVVSSTTITVPVSGSLLTLLTGLVGSVLNTQVTTPFDTATSTGKLALVRHAGSTQLTAATRSIHHSTGYAAVVNPHAATHQTTNHGTVQLVSTSQGAATHSVTRHAGTSGHSGTSGHADHVILLPDAGKTPVQLTSFDQSASASECISFCQLLSIDGSTCSSNTLGQSALATSLNVFQMLETDAELANGQSGLSLTTALNLGTINPLLSGVTASLVANVISPPAEYTGGAVGTPISDSQVNVDLQLSIPLGGLNIATVNVPISGANGTATLESVNCNTANALTSATIAASTTTATNSVTLAVLNGPPIPISSVTVDGAPSTTLTFTTAPSTQSISATSPSIQFTSVPALDDLTGLIGDTLSALTTNLVPILQSLGVSIGTADVSYLSTTCSPVTQIASS